MIIQSLVSLYDRLYQSPEIQMPIQGYTSQKVSFAVVLDIQGKLEQIKDLRVQGKKKLQPRNLLLPSIERSGQGLNPQFMWDNTLYALGAVAWNPKNVDESKRKRERALEAFSMFKEYHIGFLMESNVLELIAMANFLTEWKPDRATTLEFWNDIADTNIVFMISGQKRYIHEIDYVKARWQEIYKNMEKEEIGNCLLTGKTMPIARLHPMVKNVDGAQAKGAAIVSFNKPSFCSYGKEQSYNSPLNAKDAFKYTASLNYILRRENNIQRVKIGDTTSVFWTERKSPVESFMGVILNPRDDVGDNVKLRSFLKAAKNGQMPSIPNYDGNVKFYILGLSPNNSRLSVRFWYVCSVDQLKEKIGKHFNDLQIKTYSEHDIIFPGVWHLLKETVHDTQEPPPLLGGLLMRSILEGTNYPLNLYNGVLNRIKADQAKKNKKTGKPVQNVNYMRASILKAVLTRNYKMEVPMSLDTEKKDIAYLLGRLFAVLEKAQKDAIPGANSTIKDRFYGAASSTPAGVFPRLIRLSQHHIEKAEYGYISDKRIAEIMENIDDFPTHLNMKQQGLFAIAYYQQRNELFKSKKDKAEGEA